MTLPSPRSLGIAVLGLLLLTSCGGSALSVTNSNGKTIGVIEMTENKSATIKNTHGDVRGKIRGDVVRDSSGKHIGSIAERDGHTVMLDAKGNPVGSLDEGTKCYGKGKEMLGTVNGTVDAMIAAGACLIFFLQ